MGTVFFYEDGILLKKITVLFYVCKIYILYRFRGFFLRKKLVIVMLTDVLCLCFGMIISKLIEKP